MPASSGGRTGCFTFYRDADALSFPRLAGANAALLRAFLALPFVTFTIAAAMHWGAFRLRLRGARLVQRPTPQPRLPSWRLAKAVTILEEHCPRQSGGSRIRGEALWSIEGRI
jgi:fatty acid desaturase